MFRLGVAEIERLAVDQLALERVVIGSDRVGAMEVAMFGNIFDSYGLQVDIDVFVEVAGVERNGQFRSGAANPGVESGVIVANRNDGCVGAVVGVLAAVNEPAKHLGVLFGRIVLPDQVELLELGGSVDFVVGNGRKVVVGNGIHQVIAIVERQFEADVAGLLLAALSAVGAGVRLQLLFVEVGDFPFFNE